MLFRVSGYTKPEAMLLRWLDSVPLPGYRMGSTALQVLWSDETRGYDTQQLDRTVNVLFLSGAVEEAP